MSPKGKVLLTWVLTRGALIVLLVAPFEINALSDVAGYLDWARGAWLHGIIPGRDFAWEYPPGAAPLILLPVVHDGPYGYLMAFASILVVVDALLLLVLLQRGARTDGVVLWLVAPLLLGPVFYARFDLVPAALAAGALAVLTRRPGLGAFLLTLAAAIKLWPVALLALLARRREDLRVGLTAAVITGAVIVGVCTSTGVIAAFSSSVSQQSDRGLQVESVAATPFALARALGHGRYAYRHGAWEATAPGTHLVATAVSVLGLALLALLVIAVLRRPAPVEAALAGAAITAVLLVTDKALSPQYLTWLLALVALAATRELDRSRLVVVLTALACALTHLVYPLSYTPFLHGAWLPTAALVLRNALLLAVAVLLCRAALATRIHPDVAQAVPDPEKMLTSR